MKIYYSNYRKVSRKDIMNYTQGSEEINRMNIKEASGTIPIPFTDVKNIENTNNNIEICYESL